MSLLFSPITLRGLTVRNRAWMAPMCQYSATDGVVGDWHVVHYGARATGGVGMVLAEASAVVPEGRISPGDAGLWDDAHVPAWARVVDVVHAAGAAAGVQLAHAGRKASTPRPWEPGRYLAEADGGWWPVAPSALPFGDERAPRELATDELGGVVESFAAAARRALAAGFDTVELHAAHGYLLHQFLSPLSNTRTDAYGGDLAGRARLLYEVAEAVRAVWPQDKPVLARLSATDWVSGGWDVEETVQVVKALAALGVDLVDVSSGGLDPRQAITVGPGYQVPLAEAVRSGAGLPVAAVGLITEPEQAESVLRDGAADVVLLARQLLREPSWALRAAHELGDAIDYWPVQYQRGAWR
ncbi:MAG: NADH:flavin oxidoreductase/NADH oxidase [Kineosporiaceae bacterium]